MTQHSGPGTTSIPFVVRGQVSEGVSHTPYGGPGGDKPGGDAINEIVIRPARQAL